MTRLIKLIKRIAAGSSFILIVFSVICGGLYFLFYDSFDDFDEDYKSAKQVARLHLFNKGFVDELNPDDVRYVYQKYCYRKCHGEAAMITAVLSPAGWFQVVERMRVKENVNITGREADIIIKYLEERYPATVSRFTYQVRKKVHHAVWRNDIGQGDIYCDVILATREYLISIGAEHLIREYDLEHYYVFIVSFSVHEGEVALFDLDKVSFLSNSIDRIQATPPWQLRFQTADKHHFEALVRFKKNNISSDKKWFKLIIKNVGGSEDRVFTWNMPVKYPPEILTEGS